ncbi:hypothetical protein DL769_006842 [Monosporascus sp. CRB-8-3]|nr:hypothetical protein DL769_006842 [Monosporascus sp. CRB-8-3]
MAMGQKRKRPGSDPVSTAAKPASKLTKTITTTVVANSHLKEEEEKGKTENTVEQQQLLDLIASSPRTTPFEKRVLSLLCQIPRGRVSTYGLLSARLGSSPRAVGGALRRNPFAPRVPCHRVVATGGGLGGFKGAWPGDGVGITLDEKRRLLRGEGVRFDAKGRVLGTPWGEFVLAQPHRLSLSTPTPEDHRSGSRTAPNMCATGYLHYRDCRHIYSPTHLPCNAIGQCNGAREDGVDFTGKQSWERFVEVDESCPGCLPPPPPGNSNRMMWHRCL